MAFLTGKYQPGEQVIDGIVQTFRGRQLATGKPVFLHRIPPGSPQEQEALFKLLLIFLYSSSAAKDQVLDFGREGEIYYVVTQNLPQCLLLREWLQFELERCGERGGDSEAKLEEARGQAPYELVPEREQHSPTAEKVKESSFRAAQVQPTEGNRGEFTRLFFNEPPAPAPQAAPVKAVALVPPEMKLGEGAALSPAAAPEHEARERQSTDDRVPGDFTRLFEAAETHGQESVAESGKHAAVAQTKEAAEATGQEQEKPESAHLSAPREGAGAAPGEFTRFFESSGMHVQRYRASDLPAAVQRPAHAMTPLPPSAKGVSPQGEFTRFFSNSPSDVVRPAAPAEASTPVGNPSPLRSATDEPGEFTKMFSAAKAEPESPAPEEKGMQYGERLGGAEGAGNLPPTGAGRSAPEVRNSLFESGQIPASADLRAEKATTAPGPSEFTRVVRGVSEKPAMAEKAEQQANPLAEALPLEGMVAEAARQQKRRRTLVLVLLALLAAAVVLVVLLQLKS